MASVRTPQSSVIGSVLLTAGIILLLLFAKGLLIPLAFALTLSFMLLPGIVMLEKLGVGKALAVAIASTLTCALLVAGGYTVSRHMLHVAQTLPSYRANIQQRLASLHTSSGESFKAALSMIEDAGINLAAGQDPVPAPALPVRVVGDKSDQLRSSMLMIRSAMEPLGQIGIVLIFTIYMLMNRHELRHRVLLLAGTGNLSATTRALEDAGARISKYLLMQLEVNACYGIVFGTALHLLGVPDATLWGIVAGTLRIVPFLGPLIGTLFPLLLSIAISPSWVHPLLIVVVFLALETTLSNFIEPWLFSEHTGISSLALLSSAIFWSILWGWPGLVLSTPLTVCVVVLGRYVPQLSFLHSLLGTNAKLSPAAHIYERLLSMDQTEAWAIAERFLQGKQLVQLYDSVIIPVLSLAEEDRHKGALRDVQWEFVLLSMGELVARLSEYQPSGDSPEQRSERSILFEARRARVRKEFAVVCLAADDKADALSTAMLTQLLERAGYQTLMLAAEAISDEILEGLSAETDTVIVVSALPPFAFAQTRALCQRVRAHMPNNRIAVGLWNSADDPEEMLARFGPIRPEVVVNAMSRAITHVDRWRHDPRKTR